MAEDHGRRRDWLQPGFKWWPALTQELAVRASGEVRTQSQFACMLLPCVALRPGRSGFVRMQESTPLPCSCKIHAWSKFNSNAQFYKRTPSAPYRFRNFKKG